MGMLTAIRMVCHDAQSPFFSPCLDKKSQPMYLNAQGFYDKTDGHYRCNNIAGRVEENGMISNIYFNYEKTGLQRIGTKRGNGVLQHITLEEGEEVIGTYGKYFTFEDR